VPNKPYIVGIVGGSASGKTAFLRDLRARLPAQSCCIVSQDNYYRTINEQERDANGQPNFDLPTAIHRERFHDDMCKLLRGETISQTEYTFNHLERQGRLITVVPADIVLIEGLFLFHYEEIRRLIDLRVFVDAREDICKQRRLQRDLQERGYPPHEVEYQWEQHVMPAYRQYVLPYREDAHLIVANHAGYEKGLEVVTHHVLAMVERSSRRA
jgi:uridine kinase